MTDNQKNSIKNWKIPNVAIVLGVSSILAAYIIGFISYRILIEETEKHYRKFYLQKGLNI